MLSTGPAGLIGRTAFMSKPGTGRRSGDRAIGRSGDRETVVERPSTGDHDDHRNYRA
ncbi:hypothetical protein [Streptomyces sp. TLI_55]|uniref:hypothetical protein n=1 Tax=Streptomyces sp. TLI_55 TaxID=1938861 RepID=UPI0015CF1DB2|nr:hypothetical protein [Streptomyces sp. TLI_55]